MSNVVSEMPKWRVALMLLAIFSSTMCAMGSMVINPIASSLYEAFAGADSGLISLGISGPTLVGIPFCFLAGWMCDRFDKKLILVGGFLLFVVGGIGGAAVVNVYYFVAMRILALGLGWAFSNTAALAILADLYQEESEHGKVVGWYTTAMSVMGAALATLGGFLAVGGWENAFAAYWLSIPVLILLVFFVPSCPPTAGLEKGKAGKGADSASDAGWWKNLVPLFVQVLLVVMCYQQIMFMLSLFVSEAGLGDSSLTGLMTSTGTIATAVFALGFGLIYSKMRELVCLPAVLIMGIAFVVMSLFPYAAASFGCIILGAIGWALYMSYYNTYCVELVSPARAGTAVGIIQVASGMGSGLTSYAMMGAMGFTGQSTVAAWGIFGAVLLAVCVVSAIWLIGARKKKA